MRSSGLWLAAALAAAGTAFNPDCDILHARPSRAALQGLVLQKHWRKYARENSRTIIRKALGGRNQA